MAVWLRDGLVTLQKAVQVHCFLSLANSSAVSELVWPL